MRQFIVIICCHHNKIFHITSLNFANSNIIIKAANSLLLQQIVFRDTTPNGISTLMKPKI